MHVVSVVDEFFLGHFFGDVERLEFLDEGFAILEEGIEGQAFGEGEFVFVGDFLGFGVGNDLGFIIVLEEVFEFGLVENHDGAVDDGDLVVVGHFHGDFGGKWFETFAVEFPAGAAFEGGAGGDGLRDVEDFGFAVVTGVGELSEDALHFFELVDVIGVGVDVTIFVLDEVDEGFGAADVAELRAVNYFVLAVGFFVFAALEAFVGFFDNVAGGFLHKHGFNGGGQGVGVADAEGGVVFIEEEKFDGDVVFYLVNFVSPMEDVEDVVGAAIFAVVHVVVFGAGGVGGIGAFGKITDGAVGGVSVVAVGLSFSLGFCGLGGEDVGVRLSLVSIVSVPSGGGRSVLID